MQDSLVTDHALLRWLERIEGVDMKQVRRDLANVGATDPSFETIMRRVTQVHGFTREGIEAKILSPLVMEAIAVGLAKLRLGGITIGINGGKVITVIDGESGLAYLRDGKKKPAKKVAQEDLSRRDDAISKPWTRKNATDRGVFFRRVGRIKEMGRPKA